MQSARYSTMVLPDGAKLAYQLLGVANPGTPLVLICGTSSIRADWERLSRDLSKTRPVLVYDHRGIGDSCHSSPDCNDMITVETMARDLLYLLKNFPYDEWALLGFSLGGIIAQQLLLLPLHSSRPTSLPFRISHLFLVGTRTQVLRDGRYGLPLVPAQRDRQPTVQERRALIRNMLAVQYDPQWLNENKEKIETKVDAVLNGSPRPVHTIMKQRIASCNFDFGNSHSHISPDVAVLVIHGKLDQVNPFNCVDETLAKIRHARFVSIGRAKGQLPSLGFGHMFFDYFSVDIWTNVINTFLYTCTDRSHLGHH